MSLLDCAHFIHSLSLYCCGYRIADAILQFLARFYSMFCVVYTIMLGLL